MDKLLLRRITRSGTDLYAVVPYLRPCPTVSCTWRTTGMPRRYTFRCFWRRSETWPTAASSSASRGSTSTDISSATGWTRPRNCSWETCNEYEHEHTYRYRAIHCGFKQNEKHRVKRRDEFRWRFKITQIGKKSNRIHYDSFGVSFVRPSRIDNVVIQVNISATFYFRRRDGPVRRVNSFFFTMTRCLLM